MRTKRKRDRPDQAKHSKGESQAFAHQPFRGLLEDDRDFVKTSEPVSSSSPHGNSTEETEEDLFQRAMENVVPLKGNRNKILRSHVSKEKPRDELSDQSAKAREYLSHLVKEPAAWDISFSDEYMEGAVSGVGPKMMKRLRRGEFSIQDHVDLHGLTKKEAESAVNSFIIKSYQKDLRCVLIVHGRGLGSADHQPAIKTELPVWFRRGALKRIVLAFATAQPYDGGAGAVYVLLRKR
ncbi:MAG: DNA mismatch repair protein MutS [Desulfobacteraceae bacterium]|nr:MAG: DNA mismatch repair protein MutS [Desulfobacteraceae bacterium]